MTVTRLPLVFFFMTPRANSLVPNNFVETSIQRVKRPEYVGQVNQTLYNTVRTEAQAGKKVLVLGGDHSIAIGSIAGSEQHDAIFLVPSRVFVWVIDGCDLKVRPQPTRTLGCSG